MHRHAEPKPWKARLMLVGLGVVIVFMSFYTISIDRWSFVGLNPPPGVRGIEPTLWLALMGLVLILIGVYPWEPVGVRWKRVQRAEARRERILAPVQRAAKQNDHLRVSRRTAAGLRRPVPSRKLLT